MPFFRKRRVARLGLLLAAALHLVGGGLLASAHVDLPAPHALALAPSGGSGNPEPPPAHDAGECALCHATELRALPATGAAVPHLEPRGTPSRRSALPPPPALPLPEAPARAPPAAA